jgi:hypothetical protein
VISSNGFAMEMVRAHLVLWLGLGLRSCCFLINQNLFLYRWKAPRM